MRRYLLFLAFALLLVSPSFGDEPAGKKQFLEHTCNKCHSIESFEIEARVKSEKMKGPDLSTVGDRRDAEWIVKFVQKEVENEGKNHKGKFEGSKKQLTTISDWLASLKTP